MAPVVTAAGALVGCSLCGAETLIQVAVSNTSVREDGEVTCDVEVDSRDQERLELFWSAHREPWAKALSGAS